MSDISLTGSNDSLYDLYNSNLVSSGEKLKNSINNDNLKDSTDEELMNACKQFESYFTEQVFKEMEKTVDIWNDEEGDSSSKYKDYATENLIQKYATSSSEHEGGIGLAQMLYKQMKRNYNI